MANSLFQRDLVSRVAKHAQNKIRRGYPRSEAFAEAWCETEKPVYQVRYHTFSARGIFIGTTRKDFRKSKQAIAYMGKMEQKLSRQEAESLELVWNTAADRKIAMDRGYYNEAEAEIIYNRH